MDRGELEGLDRESLVVRAQAAGIRRARILTRPELIDELLRLDSSADDAQLRKSRGFFGRARDLVARVVERGLHLPDAADRIRTLTGGGLTLTVPRTEPQAMPTVTLAEIYAAQGHSQRAIETLRRVLEREPEHAAARALLARLEDSAYVAPPPPLPPEPEVEPELSAAGGLDEAEHLDAHSVTDDAQVEELRDSGEAHTVDMSVTEMGDMGARSLAATAERPAIVIEPPIEGPIYEGSNGEAEFTLAPASDRGERDEIYDDPAYAPTRELPRGTGRTYAFAAPRVTTTVDVNAATDVFDTVAARGRPPGGAAQPSTSSTSSAASTPSAAEAPVAIEELDEVDECYAIPLPRDAAGGRMYVRWSVSFSGIGALLGTRPRGRFVVRAYVVTPGWDGPNTETRDLSIDPDAGEVTLQALPEPAVVRVAVGWLDGHTFVPLAHSPVLEPSGRGLVVRTLQGVVPVVLEKGSTHGKPHPRAASMARALDGSKRALQAHG